MIPEYFKKNGGNPERKMGFIQPIGFLEIKIYIIIIKRHGFADRGIYTRIRIHERYKKSAETKQDSQPVEKIKNAVKRILTLVLKHGQNYGAAVADKKLMLTGLG